MHARRTESVALDSPSLSPFGTAAQWEKSSRLAKSIACPNEVGQLALRRRVGARPTVKLARLSRILQHGRYALLIDA
jgi:hypothetical protein